MGANCSSPSETPYIMNETLSVTNTNMNYESYSNITDPSLYHIFYFKTYRQYSEAMKFFKEKLKEILTKLSQINQFVPPKRLKKESEFLYYNYFDDVSFNSLYDIAMSIYQKIGSVYGSIPTYPKEELSKITYSLLSKYYAYDYGNDEPSLLITEKIIKRTNFFTEDFPFKLKKLDTIILSKQIFVFGYDKNLRLNFYIEPYGNNNITNKNLIGNTNNTELNEDLFYFNDKNNYNISTEPLLYSNIITYIFFIIEHVLPLFKEKYNFSSIINITINFGGKAPDTEMISYIMTYFTNIYPLGLGKVHIVNFKMDVLIRNKSFKEEIEKIDFFRNLIFHDERYQLQLIKETNANCLPITYGGYHSLLSYQIDKNCKLEDFIKYTLSMILVNSKL
jgi:hypothetical protein